MDFSISGVSYDDEWEKPKATVLYFGLVYKQLVSLFQTSCKANVYKFPFDQQECTIALVNSLSPADYANFSLSAHAIDLDIYFPITDWTLISATATTAYKDYSFKLATVTFSFILKRQSTFYVVTMILPSLFLSMIGLMVFPLPPDSGEKVSLNVACLMSFFINQLAISEEFPSSWDAMPVIGE